MSNKVVKIACQGAGTFAIEMLEPLQGELKSLAKEDYERLKREILEDGFSFPFAVWEDGSALRIIDGHQRHRTLTMMKAEGYSIPQLPVVMIEARDIAQAKHKLLAAASQYGTVQEDGLMAFLKDVDFSAEELIASFRFPELDLQDFVSERLLIKNDPLDFSVVGAETPVPESRNGDSHGFASAPLAADQEPILALQDQVRMVQLFLDGVTQPEFLQKVVSLQKHLKTNNLTETVLRVVREAHSNLIPN